MARKRTARHPRPEAAQAELEATEPSQEGTVTKAEAVRRAVAAGKESPDEGVAYIKEQFDIDIAKPHFSSTKSQLKKKQGGSAKGGQGRKPRQTAPASAPAPPPINNGGMDLLETLEAIKQLVSEHGADKVKRLVDLVG